MLKIIICKRKHTVYKTKWSDSDIRSRTRERDGERLRLFDEEAIDTEVLGMLNKLHI